MLLWMPRPTVSDAAPASIDELASGFLSRWRRTNISRADMEHAASWVVLSASNMNSVPGGWRAQVVGGTLFVKALIVRNEWAERASALLMLLQLAPSLPNVDIVHVHHDGDPAPTFGWDPQRCCGGSRSRSCGTQQVAPCPESSQVALLTSGFSGPWRGHPSPRRWMKSSFPLPDFTWVGWGAHQPPWCQLGPALEAAAALHPWDTRVDAAFFAGSLTNGRHRQRLGRLAAHSRAHGLLHVHATTSAFFHYSANGSRVPLAHRNGVTAAAAAGAFLPIEEACRYRYALSVPGYGYSSRLKALLACGCTVLHVRSSPREYYYPLLRNGTHLIEVPNVDRILPALRSLQADAPYAQRIGEAGRAFARTTLAYAQVLRYFRRLLSAIAARQPEMARVASPDDGFTPVRSGAELARLLSMQPCIGSRSAGQSRACCSTPLTWDCPSRLRGCTA